MSSETHSTRQHGRQIGKRNKFSLAPLLLLLSGGILVVGCGGGTGTSSSVAGSAITSASDSTGRAALNVYVTDAFTDQYKQVLTTLYKIELTTDGTNYTTVYSSTAGQTLDLASLASTAALLSTVTVPTGTYTQARITFGDHITLVSNTGTSTSVAVDPSVGTDTNGQIAIVVATPTRVQANQTNTVFVDFKLAEFQLAGNVLKPSISCAGGMGNNQPPSAGGSNGQPVKGQMGHLIGTVANLNGTTSFALQGPNGRTITVMLTSTTTITSGQTGNTIALAKGQNVIVDGAFDPTTATVTATSVTLNDYTTINHAQSIGTVASINSAASSFVLTVQFANNIQPTSGTITVVTNANTQFGKGRFQPASFTDVTAGGTVVVSGTFDTPTQTLTANFVGLH